MMLRLKHGTQSLCIPGPVMIGLQETLFNLIWKKGRSNEHPLDRKPACAINMLIGLEGRPHHSMSEWQFVVNGTNMAYKPLHDKTSNVVVCPAKTQISLGIRHPPSLIRVFAVCMKKAWVLSYPLSAQRRLWSDWADAQADLSLCWAHSHFVGFVIRRLIWSLSSPTVIMYVFSQNNHTNSLKQTRIFNHKAFQGKHYSASGQKLISPCKGHLICSWDHVTSPWRANEIHPGVMWPVSREPMIFMLVAIMSLPVNAGHL